MDKHMPSVYKQKESRSGDIASTKMQIKTKIIK